METTFRLDFARPFTSRHRRRAADGARSRSIPIVVRRKKLRENSFADRVVERRLTQHAARVSLHNPSNTFLASHLQFTEDCPFTIPEANHGLAANVVNIV